MFDARTKLVFFRPMGANGAGGVLILLYYYYIIYDRVIITGRVDGRDGSRGGCWKNPKTNAMAMHLRLFSGERFQVLKVWWIGRRQKPRNINHSAAVQFARAHALIALWTIAALALYIYVHYSYRPRPSLVFHGTDCLLFSPSRTHRKTFNGPEEQLISARQQYKTYIIWYYYLL